MKGHDAVIRLLDAFDLDTVFTLMSEDTMRLMSKVEANWGDDVRLVKSRHEQGAVAMADGYARASDRIGVCLVGRGPAVAQTGTAMITARKKGSDVLAIVPRSPLSEEYDIKNFEQESFLRSTIGNVLTIQSTRTVVPLFQEAVRQVTAGDGPLAVQIPWDVLDSEIADPGDVERDDALVPGVGTSSGAHVRPDPDLVERAIDIYVESDALRPPVVLAGRGAVQSDAKDAIETLASRTSSLLATSLQARNYFSDHPFYLGFTGKWGNNLANRYTAESHLVFAVGASLNPYTIDDGHVLGDDTQVIHVDRDPAGIGQHVDVDLGIQGDARVTVEALVSELDRRGIDRDGELWSDRLRREIGDASTMNTREFPDVPGTVDPRDLVRTLNEILPENRKVVTDAGHHTRWVMDAIDTPPEDFTFTLDFASVGLGLPMGVGTAVAAGDQACITICGDAGLMMSIQELETAVRNDVPITVVVVNDASLGSEYHSLEADAEDPDVALVPSPDFADVAESVGADGYTVRSVADLEALGETLGRKPDGQVVVDCKVNHFVRHRSKM